MSPEPKSVWINSITCHNSQFFRWFGNSRVTDEFGRPLTVHRGEHGPLERATNGKSEKLSDGAFQTRLGALSFGSERAARIYALRPNQQNDFPIAPRVTSAYLSIRNPIMNRPNDPFIELDEIAKAIGESITKNVAISFSNYITNTCRWIDDIEKNLKRSEII